MLEGYLADGQHIFDLNFPFFIAFLSLLEISIPKPGDRLGHFKLSFEKVGLKQLLKILFKLELITANVSNSNSTFPATKFDIHVF